MKEVELVILLNGNFLPIRIDESRKKELDVLLGKCYKASFDDPAHFIKWGDATILSKSLVGWYFREPVKSPAEKLLKMVEKDLSPGEDWKNNDE